MDDINIKELSDDVQGVVLCIDSYDSLILWDEIHNDSSPNIAVRVLCANEDCNISGIYEWAIEHEFEVLELNLSEAHYDGLAIVGESPSRTWVEKLGVERILEAMESNIWTVINDVGSNEMGDFVSGNFLVDSHEKELDLYDHIFSNMNQEDGLDSALQLIEHLKAQSNVDTVRPEQSHVQDTVFDPPIDK